MAAAAARAKITDLSDRALAAVFERVPQQERRSLALVCRRFRAVACASGDLWKASYLCFPASFEHSLNLAAMYAWFVRWEGVMSSLHVDLSTAAAWAPVAAVLGVIHAMGALDQSPEVLGGLIGAALVGTFGGIFLSYGVMAPVAAKIDVVRTKQLRLYTLVKQSLLAFMNGAMPQVAVEFGRKTIPSKERPTIDTVENETSLGGGGSAVKEAA